MRASHRLFGQQQSSSTPQDGVYQHQNPHQVFLADNVFHDLQLLSVDHPKSFNEPNFLNQENVYQSDDSNQSNNSLESNITFETNTSSSFDWGNLVEPNNTFEPNHSFEPSFEFYQSNSSHQPDVCTQFTEFEQPIDFDAAILQTNHSNELSFPQTLENIQISYFPTNPLNDTFGDQIIFTLETNQNQNLETSAQKEKKRGASVQLSNAEKCKLFRDSQKQKKINLAKELEKELDRNTSLKWKVKRMEEKVAKIKQIVLKNAKKQDSNNRANIYEEIMQFI